MTYQVRVTDADGSNSIILDKADNITYNKVINTPNEGINFELPASDSKSILLDNTKFWEFWDIAANERLNRGPIHSLDYGDGGVLKVSGPGRSQLLLDHIQADLAVFYTAIPKIIDDLRFENVAASPSTKTYVWDGSAATKALFFSGLTIDEEQYMQYYGLSKQTKDNAIDDNDGYILPGLEKPSNTYTTTNSYWAGTDKIDSLVIDLGAAFTIPRTSIKFPWWSGITRGSDRGFTFKFAYSNHTDDIETMVESDWIQIYEDTSGRHGGTYTFFFQEDDGDVNSIERNHPGAVFIDIDPVTTRYFRILITDVKAWYGSVYDDLSPVNKWGHQCDPDSTDDISARTTSSAYPNMHGKKISDRVLEPQNDCYASIVEFKAFTSLLERNEISPLIKQRIKSDNKQITYFHTADPSETITIDNYRKYEPTSFFRHAEISYTGASSSYTKFFAADCTNCYSSFHFGIVDDFNSLIYRSNNTSGSNIDISIPRYARSITMKGSATAVVNNIDAWLSKIDPLSWGSQYTYSSTAGDYLTIGFRGASFTWWATIPSTETGATVLVKIRERDDDTGNWSAWTTLESGLVLPNNITSEVVYDIPYATTLISNKSYEVYIENLDGGYVSADSFGGWWTGSMISYNDDSDRFIMRFPDQWKQIYDNRFSNGSMFKTNRINNNLSIGFQGDRVQIYSAKGRNHGNLTISMFSYGIALSEYDTEDDNRVFIPGGNPTVGYLTIDLDTGKKGHEIPGVLIFDSDDYTGWKVGIGGPTMDTLPWRAYNVTIAIATGTDETYMADATVEDSDQFVARCSDCTPEADGDTEIDKFIYLDGIEVHERATMSAHWKLEKNLDVLQSISEAFEFEWDVGEQGLTVSPRVGIDTDIILKEGYNTVISSEIIKDGSKMATQLFSSGADIDGLPLFSIVENRVNKEIMGRTVQQIQDYRAVADYFTLIGVSRAELVRRREPEYRINVSHIGYEYGLNSGDSFIAKKQTLDPMRVRINSLIINQSKSSGITYNMECIKWPPIV